MKSARPMAGLYTHEPLDEEVTSIAGHYVLKREVRLPYRGNEVLYVLGHALFDTSCCGVGGCGYAIVPGVLRRWHASTDEKGQPVSEVRPITDADSQAEIRGEIVRREGAIQVSFL